MTEAEQNVDGERALMPLVFPERPEAVANVDCLTAVMVY